MSTEVITEHSINRAVVRGNGFEIISFLKMPIDFGEGKRKLTHKSGPHL